MDVAEERERLGGEKDERRNTRTENPQQPTLRRQLRRDTHRNEADRSFRSGKYRRRRHLPRVRIALCRRVDPSLNTRQWQKWQISFLLSFARDRFSRYAAQKQRCRCTPSTPQNSVPKTTRGRSCIACPSYIKFYRVGGSVGELRKKFYDAWKHENRRWLLLTILLNVSATGPLTRF